MTCCPGAALGMTLTSERVHEWNPQPNVVTIALADGMPAPTTLGTATARTVNGNAANALDALCRTGYVSAAAINSAAGARTAQYAASNGVAAMPGPPTPSRAGWKVLLAWGVSDAVLNAEAKMFVGMIDQAAAIAAADPATFNDAVGFGQNTGDANLQLFCRGIGASVKRDLGADFVVAAGGGFKAIIEYPYYSTANPVRVTWRVMNLANGAVASGVEPVDTPRMTQRAAIQFWRCTGPANAAAVGIDLIRARLVTPN